ncbi:MAG: multicopper oxidase family protein [Proteobacteria bacterium]|nr:multicopper oxidase family protein [Pseudomonadota bacterium]
MHRRDVLKFGASLPAAALLGATNSFARDPAAESADHVLRIAPANIELAPGVVVKTTAYNGQVPGPVLRLTEGRPVSIDVHNASPLPELVHWHGLDIPPLMDGAMEEGSPMIPAGGRFRYLFSPKPAGTRWYHTHTMADEHLDRAGFTGQFGFLIIEPSSFPGDYDQEILLAMHHWEPHMMAANALMAGCDIAYRHASFNGRLFGHDDPIRVREGERVLFRFLNASASEAATIALPNHRFRVVAMDGNALQVPRVVDQLYLGVGERIDAIVEMHAPGVWVLGSSGRGEREMGLGRVVEYAGRSGKPVWADPAFIQWDYALFGDATPRALGEATVLPMQFRMIPADKGMFARWTINGKSYQDSPVQKLNRGERYRLSFTNYSRCPHPVHTHRTSFEIVSIAGKRTSGVFKDVMSLPTYATAEVEFVATSPGRALFHCHQQQHMDAGFMQLFDIV